MEEQRGGRRHSQLEVCCHLLAPESNFKEEEANPPGDLLLPLFTNRKPHIEMDISGFLELNFQQHNIYFIIYNPGFKFCARKIKKIRK